MTILNYNIYVLEMLKEKVSQGTGDDFCRYLFRVLVWFVLFVFSVEQDEQKGKAAAVV